MRSFCWVVFFSLLMTEIVAQPSTEEDILSSFRLRKKRADESVLKLYPVRNIGPTVQGGRIVDIDVNLEDTKEFYVGFASGGIFRTTNNGITFEPVFDNVDAIGIGDFMISQRDTRIIYVGTGEKNSSRSSYAGSGVYKTMNGGKDWEHLGLTGTQHVSRVIIHPADDNTVWVGAMGALYSNNPERGVFKTNDGGKTWKKTLFINDSTGVIDLVINPKNADELWAATWERTRKSWHFKGHGPSSAIYHSVDGGETWIRSAEGFPQGRHTGRIGLDVSPAQPNIVYAVLDNQEEVEDKKKARTETGKLQVEDFREMSKEDFLKLDDAKVDEFLKGYSLPKKYTSALLKKEVREGKYLPKAISEYHGADANKSLFKTKVRGAELYRSENSGRSWKKVNSYDLDGVFHSYGYYFSEIKISPYDPDVVYLFGVPLLKSEDGGITWHRLDTLKGIREIHVDQHALWINPQDGEHMLLGNDGGLYQSYDGGANWLHINNMPAGQFYTVNVDMETPYNVYGGLQDNGVLKGSSKSVPNKTKHWKPLFSGDGMFVIPHPGKPDLIYTGYQFGNYFRLEMHKSKWDKITPQHDVGQPPYRWNWRAPLLLSKHNNDILYTAANKVFRSMNGGEVWEVISEDLTKQKRSGNVPLSTITCLAESPLRFGLLYAGTDDGNVWMSHDGGVVWNNRNTGLPADLWVSSVFPSPHDEATVFLSLNGYREDEFRTHLFMSTDYGKHWTSIKSNLPESVANVIIQDPVHPDLLYCGLDNGTYTSFDKGGTWHLFNGFLNVPAYDMLVHPVAHQLVVATHGRSVFIADVKPLQELAGSDGLKKKIMAFQPEDIRYHEKWGEKQYPWSAANVPEATVLYYTANDAAVKVEVRDEKGDLVHTAALPGKKGFNVFRWDLTVSITGNVRKSKGKKAVAEQPVTTPYAQKGKYRFMFKVDQEISEVVLEIK